MITSLLTTLLQIYYRVLWLNKLLWISVSISGDQANSAFYPQRTEDEYRPKCGDALRLGSKGMYGSFHLWINVWVAGKTV